MIKKTNGCEKWWRKKTLQKKKQLKNKMIMRNNDCNKKQNPPRQKYCLCDFLLFVKFSLYDLAGNII